MSLEMKCGITFVSLGIVTIRSLFIFNNSGVYSAKCLVFLSFIHKYCNATFGS